MRAEALGWKEAPQAGKDLKNRKQEGSGGTVAHGHATWAFPKGSVCTRTKLDKVEMALEKQGAKRLWSRLKEDAIKASRGQLTTRERVRCHQCRLLWPVIKSCSEKPKQLLAGDYQNKEK